jgi:hypothetical protein
VKIAAPNLTDIDKAWEHAFVTARQAKGNPERRGDEPKPVLVTSSKRLAPLMELNQELTRLELEFDGGHLPLVDTRRSQRPRGSSALRRQRHSQSSRMRKV